MTVLSAADREFVDAMRRIATRAHAGQVDKQGVAYIGHPAAVARMVDAAGGSVAQIAAAWGHDVVEDTDITPEQLLQMLPEHPARQLTVAIIVAVSRPPGVTYMDFIRSIPPACPEAVLVKDKDLAHNSDPERRVYDDDGNPIINTRYPKARKILEPYL